MLRLSSHPAGIEIDIVMHRHCLQPFLVERDLQDLLLALGCQAQRQMGAELGFEQRQALGAPGPGGQAGRAPRVWGEGAAGARGRARPGGGAGGMGWGGVDWGRGLVSVSVIVSALVMARWSGSW